MARLPCIVISKIIGDKVHPYIFYKRSHVDDTDKFSYQTGIKCVRLFCNLCFLDFIFYIVSLVSLKQCLR